MQIGSREDWYKLAPKDLWKKDCPFCDQNNTPLIKSFEYWYICKNKYPYCDSPDHLLVIPKQHKKYTHELTPQEYAELHKIDIFMNNYYKGNDYFSFIRQSFTGRSLEHLHYHYLPWFLSGPDLEYILEQKN
jgi:diadenosine tetraphosphate (Ap4A) HIT family hydrolase